MKQSNWEERLINEFGDGDGGIVGQQESIINFFSIELATQRKELLEEIENAMPNFNALESFEEIKGYDKCKEDIKQILNLLK